MKEAERARGRKGTRETVAREILYTCHSLHGSAIPVVEKCWWVVFQWAFQLRKKCLLALAGTKKGLRNSSLASRFCLKTLQWPAFSIFSSCLLSFSFSYLFLSLSCLSPHLQWCVSKACSISFFSFFVHPFFKPLHFSGPFYIGHIMETLFFFSLKEYVLCGDALTCTKQTSLLSLPMPFV